MPPDVYVKSVGLSYNHSVLLSTLSHVLGVIAIEVCNNAFCSAFNEFVYLNGHSTLSIFTVQPHHLLNNINGGETDHMFGYTHQGLIVCAHNAPCTVLFFNIH